MKKTYRKILLSAAIVFLLDQSAKYLVLSKFNLNESLPVITNVFHLTFVTNTGSAFGLFRNLSFLLTLFSFAVLLFAVYYATKIKEGEKWMQIAIGLLIGGTLGNLADRMIHGHVIDFLDFRVWPVFNVADSAITVSVIILVILVWKK